MLCQKRRNFFVHDRNLNRLHEHCELRRKRKGERRTQERKRLAIFKDAEDRLVGANRSPSVQKQCQASANDGENCRDHEQSLFLEFVAGDKEERRE